jgi:hypothetical protein
MNEFTIAVMWYAAIVGSPLLMFFWLAVHVISDHLVEKRFAATLKTRELAEHEDTTSSSDQPQRKVDRLVWVIRHPGARARSRTGSGEREEPRQRQAA